MRRRLGKLVPSCLYRCGLKCVESNNSLRDQRQRSQRSLRVVQGEGQGPAEIRRVPVAQRHVGRTVANVRIRLTSTVTLGAVAVAVATAAGAKARGLVGGTLGSIRG